jgi:Fur family transcriptional regulator, peroxide stress response regulator
LPGTAGIACFFVEKVYSYNYFLHKIVLHYAHKFDSKKKRMVHQKTRFDKMRESLKRHDSRITPQRMAVIKILATSEGHPSVENIFEQVKKRFPTTSLATVYKTVTLLKELNEVLELGFPEGGNRYDGHRPYPHPHLIRTKCKKIIDLDLESLEGVTQELVSDTGFKITSHRLGFFGLCPKCQG